MPMRSCLPGWSALFCKAQPGGIEFWHIQGLRGMKILEPGTGKGLLVEDSQVLIEEFLDGTEVSVGVITYERKNKGHAHH